MYCWKESSRQNLILCEVPIINFQCSSSLSLSFATSSSVASPLHWTHTFIPVSVFTQRPFSGQIFNHTVVIVIFTAVNELWGLWVLFGLGLFPLVWSWRFWWTLPASSLFWRLASIYTLLSNPVANVSSCHRWQKQFYPSCLKQRKICLGLSCNICYLVENNVHSKLTRNGIQEVWIQ